MHCTLSHSILVGCYQMCPYGRPQRWELYATVPIGDREEKITALRAICQRFLPHHMDAFDDAIARSLDRTAVVRITLTEPPVGKRKQYDKDGEEMKWGRME